MDEGDALVTMFPIARRSERFSQLAKEHLPNRLCASAGSYRKIQPLKA